MAEKVVLVTGGSRGIGLAVANRLRRDGWRVETAERASGVDMADPDAARAAVERLDRIDALVANAGTMIRKPALEHTVEDWRHVLDVNLVAAAATAQTAAKKMLEQGTGGAVVLTASQLSFFGGVNAAAYAASKGGVAQLTKALSNELAGIGIRVNAVAPGFIDTDMTSDIEDWKRREVDARIPIGRWGTPEDVAGAVAWLLSDDARYVTGAIVPV